MSLVLENFLQIVGFRLQSARGRSEVWLSRTWLSRNMRAGAFLGFEALVERGGEFPFVLGGTGGWLVLWSNCGNNGSRGRFVRRRFRGLRFRDRGGFCTDVGRVPRELLP